MLAALLYGPNDLRVEEVDTPDCNEDQMLLRVKAVGLCGTDLRTINSGHKKIRYPQIMGHEVAGDIAKVGKNVRNYEIGDRVYVSPIIPCGECPPCRRGWINMCEKSILMGITLPGAFAEYMVITKEIIKKGQIIHMSEKMSYEAATLTEPLSSVYDCQEKANVTLGDNVVVIGMGPIGCLHVELAKLRGATRVIAIEQSQNRLEVANQCGADLLINSLKEDPVARVKEITNGWGGDKVISANPSTQAQKQAIEMASKRGVVIFFGGVPHGKLTEIDTNMVHYKELTIMGQSSYNHISNFKAFMLIASGRLDAKRYITHMLPLKDINKGVELARKGEALKVVLKP